MKTYLFYDVETSGLNPAFDQILTFAGIRTDLQLNEIERHSLVIQLRKDIMPSPGAFVTHGLIGDILTKGLTEYRAALQLHALFNAPGTVSVGYNSLGFDDEFLRFLFYRNLLDPYSHQYANGCSRMDMLPVAALYRVFCESALDWPCLENGKPSLKLELISRANGFETSGHAHEAMADVEALVALSKKFAGMPDVWAYACHFFDKEKELPRISGITTSCGAGASTFKLGIAVSASFGPALNYLAPVFLIGRSEAYKNQDLWVRLDLPWEVDPDTGMLKWAVIRKRAADETIVLPCLDRFWNRLDQAAAHRAFENMETLKTPTDMVLNTIDACIEYQYPFIPDLDPDAELYQAGFFSGFEKREMAAFHGAPDGQKPKVLSSMKSSRIRKLAGRILSRNFDHIAFDNQEFKGHMARLKAIGEPGAGAGIKGFRNDRKTTREQALAQIKEIGGSPLDSRSQKALAWVKAYLENMG